MTRSEVEAFILDAAEENVRLGVTGALVATPFSAVMVLEGPRRALDAVLKNHPNATVLSCRHSVERRLFPSKPLDSIIVDDDKAVGELERRFDDAQARGDESACEALVYRAIWRRHRDAA